MFNHFECIVFLLEKAKEQIRKKDQEYICFAIDDALCDLFLKKPPKQALHNPKTLVKMLQARDAIKGYIRMCLGGTYSYEEWAHKKGYPAYEDEYDDNVKDARMAWIDDMINKASKGLL